MNITVNVPFEACARCSFMQIEERRIDIEQAVRQGEDPLLIHRSCAHYLACNRAVEVYQNRLKAYLTMRKVIAEKRPDVGLKEAALLQEIISWIDEEAGNKER